MTALSTVRPEDHQPGRDILQGDDADHRRTDQHQLHQVAVLAQEGLPAGLLGLLGQLVRPVPLPALDDLRLASDRSPGRRPDVDRPHRPRAGTNPLRCRDDLWRLPLRSWSASLAGEVDLRRTAPTGVRTRADPHDEPSTAADSRSTREAEQGISGDGAATLSMAPRTRRRGGAGRQRSMSSVRLSPLLRVEDVHPARVEPQLGVAVVADAAHRVEGHDELAAHALAVELALELLEAGHHAARARRRGCRRTARCPATRSRPR